MTNQWPSTDSPHRVLVARQVEALRRSGVETDVLFVDGSTSRLNYVRAARDLLALTFRTRRYDVIHAHTGHCGVVACAQLRYPVVLTYVGYDLHPESADRLGSPLEQARAALERLVFRQLSRLVAATTTKSAQGADRLPRSVRRRTEVIPGGIDRSDFVATARAEARWRLGWTYDDPVVLFAADPSRYSKRFELAEAAVAAALAEVPDLRLVVADRVPPAEMPLWMSAADVLLLTSRGEGSPNVVKEAMACDLPIVSVDVGDVRQVIEGARLCHIRPAEAHALADALITVVHALPERSDGREHSADFDIETVTRRMVATYARALSRGPGPLGFVPWESFALARRKTV